MTEESKGNNFPLNSYRSNPEQDGALKTIDVYTYYYTHDVPNTMTAINWNTQNELKSIMKGSEATYYQYSNGDRVRKLTDKGTIKEERIYLGNFEIYRKFEGGSLKIERQTVHVNDDTGRIAMLEKRTFGSAVDDNGTVESLERYVYSNHLQSASLELDENGAIISYEEYHPYGTTSYQANNSDIKAIAKRYRYTGKERDEESGLYYHGARYYVPWLARWVSLDPINSESYNIEKGNPERNKERSYTELTASPYSYCANNPTNKIDPNGEKEFKSYDDYKTYQQQNKQEVLAKNKIGEQGHWLKSDRTSNSAVWDAANWHNIKNEKEGQYAPFEQIRDLYKWVRKEAKNQGHDVRWMMGADLLVSELPIIDNFSYFLPAGFNDLMKELNLNIANFAIHKFKELLVDRGEQIPIIGAEAYLWDKEFIEVEQGKVAPPVYKKYQENYPRAIDFLNIISQKAVTDRLINSTVSIYLEIFGEIPAMEASVMDDQYRIDFPLLMLYPNRHKPTHKKVIKHQKERKLEFMKIKFPKISN